MLRLTGILSLSFAMAGCASALKGPKEDIKVLDYTSKAEISIPASDDQSPVYFNCPAKLDTGARTSSIHAENIRYNEDESMVSFEIDGKTLASPVVRSASIKKRTAEEQGFESRPVIRIKMSVNGSVFTESEVSLTNREQFKYPLLIGRNTLKKLGYYIDPGATDLLPARTTAKCSLKEPVLLKL